MSAANPISELTFRIRHTMLPVADLDRSLDFYSRMLGMKVVKRRSNPARKQEVGYVGYGDEATHHTLELIADETVKTVEPTAGHVAVGVNDLSKLCEFLNKEGVVFRQQPVPNRPGDPNLTAFIKDPDGHELELTERHPG